MPGFNDVFEAIARKAHECCACGNSIRPRQTYYQHTSNEDGSWSNDKVCTPCQHLLERLLNVSGYDSIAFSDLHSEAKMWGLEHGEGE